MKEVIDIRNVDAIQALKELDSESIDLIVSDPPYKITSRGATGTMSGYWTSDISKKGKIFKHNDITPSDYFADLYRVLKERSILYIMTNNLNLRDMLNEGERVGFNFVKSLIWEKPNKICGRYYMGNYEYILLFRKGKDKPINNPGTSDILKVPFKKLKGENNKNLHDTEKPVELMKILIENSSQKGDTVLDMFMGIGTTGIACVETGRKFIGFEIDEEYYKIAEERIEDTLKNI